MSQFWSSASCLRRARDRIRTLHREREKEQETASEKACVRESERETQQEMTGVRTLAAFHEEIDGRCRANIDQKSYVICGAGRLKQPAAQKPPSLKIKSGKRVFENLTVNILLRTKSGKTATHYGENNLWEVAFGRRDHADGHICTLLESLFRVRDEGLGLSVLDLVFSAPCVVFV